MNTFTSFDGTRIAFHDEGDGSPVVLAHGFGHDGLTQFGPFERSRALLERVHAGFREVLGKAPPMLDPPIDGRPGLIARLRAAGARVIVPDMRGFGESGKPQVDAAYADSAMARDIVALVRHLGIRAYDVLGFSMGAVTVARLLALGETGPRSAVLAGVGDYILDGEVMNLPKHFPIPADSPRPLTMHAHANALAAVLDGGEIVPGNLMSMVLIAVRATGADPRALAAAVRGAVAPQIPRESLRGVRIPVLVLNGSTDVANQAIERLLDAMPTARPGVCDGNHQSAPWEPSFQEAVVDFLKSPGSHPAGRAEATESRRRAGRAISL